MVQVFHKMVHKGICAFVNSTTEPGHGRIRQLTYFGQTGAFLHLYLELRSRSRNIGLVVFFPTLCRLFDVFLTSIVVDVVVVGVIVVVVVCVVICHLSRFSPTGFQTCCA